MSNHERARKGRDDENRPGYKETKSGRIPRIGDAETSGNGRTSRLLMNLELMKDGFPPVLREKGFDVISTSEAGNKGKSDIEQQKYAIIPNAIEPPYSLIPAKHPLLHFFFILLYFSQYSSAAVSSPKSR
jgi:hypothetical protein